ncbi:sulfatase-like hydrolase/transferase [Bacteroidota bacterium]
MTFKKGILYGLSLITFILAGCVKNTVSPPNIVIFIVDDAGYADFGFMGSEDLETPNIDKLATKGIIFTDAHVSASVCSPSRAGLLTGRYQQRFGFECNDHRPDQGLDTSEVTLGTALQQAGYATAALGKWHVGWAREYQPNNRGFDYFFGFLPGNRGYYYDETKDDAPGHPKAIMENGEPSTFEGYLTYVLADKAVEFIDQVKDRPFFLYWSPNAVHTPMEANQEDLARYEGHPRQILAAMTWAMDQAIGEIIEKLEQENLIENTLIFFLSDNGGAVWNQSSNIPLKGFKGNKFEAGHRVPFIISWPEKLKGGRTFGGLISSLDIFPTCLEAAGIEKTSGKSLDGVSLIPYLSNEKTGSPHESLYWRKEIMAAGRQGPYKLIRVDSLGYRMYNLDTDLGETFDLSLSDTARFRIMVKNLRTWEKEMMPPLWSEGIWNKVTWLIHEDLYNNRPVRVTTPDEMQKMIEENKETKK